MSLQPSPKICPVCQEESNFKFIRDFSSQRGNFSLYECVKCYVQFWEPFRSPGPEWYKAQKKYATKEPRLYRGYHKKFLSLYPTFPEGTKILDVGCGRGELLQELRKRGCECWGVDFDELTIRAAKERLRLQNLFSMDLIEFLGKKDLPEFDIITSFEVIEHLDDPLSFLQGIKKHLKKSGKIILSTPSRERLMPDEYSWDFPPTHLSRWNEEAIATLAKKINFEISSVHYVDQFLHLFELFSEKTRSGLVKKIVKFISGKKKDISEDQKKTTCVPAKEDFSNKSKLLPRLLLKAAKIKNALVAGIPAVLVCSLSRALGIKNGVMVIELVSSKRVSNFQ